MRLVIYKNVVTSSHDCLHPAPLRLICVSVWLRGGVNYTYTARTERQNPKTQERSLSSFGFLLVGPTLLSLSRCLVHWAEKEGPTLNIKSFRICSVKGTVGGDNFPLLPVFMLNQAKRLLASSVIRRREWNQSTHSSLSTLEKNVYFPKMPL